MAKPFLPTKLWQWALVPLLVVLVAATFWPVCAYSGPGPGGVAASIAGQRRETGIWPAEIKDHAGRFSATLLRVEGGSAVYRIHAGCGPREEWRLFKQGRSTRMD